jgi:glycosyltransferase involved in cell wall biosynthesis
LVIHHDYFCEKTYPNLKILLVADILVRDFDGCNRTLYQLIDRTYGKVDYYFIVGKHEGLYEGAQVYKVPNFAMPMNADYEIAFPYFRSTEYEEIMDTFRPDIVHITSPSLLGSKIQKIAKDKGYKVSTIYHTNFISYLDYYIGKTNILTNPIRQFLINNYRDFYNNCDKILAPTRSMQDHLIDLEINADLIEIMPRGINKDLFKYNERTKIRYKDHFENKHHNILFASRLVWEKNLQVIIDLYNKVEEESLPYNFIIAGSGVAYEEMNEKMKKALFLGNLSQSELSEAYNEADLFFFPSVTETFGNVVLEAMSCGLPVVAAKGGSNYDVVRNDVDGILIDASDLNGYILAFEKILKYSTSYIAYKNHALSSPLLCSWQEIADIFLQTLTELSQKEH